MKYLKYFESRNEDIISEMEDIFIELEDMYGVTVEVSDLRPAYERHYVKIHSKSISKEECLKLTNHIFDLSKKAELLLGIKFFKEGSYLVAESRSIPETWKRLGGIGKIKYFSNMNLESLPNLFYPSYFLMFDS